MPELIMSICKNCKIEKPTIFFGAINGIMNSVCKKCCQQKKHI